MKLKLITALLLILSFSAFSQEIEGPRFGKGILNIVGKDSTWSMNMAARMQFLSTTSWDYDGDQYGKAESNFLVRRARLKFSGFAYTPKLEYKLELGLSNRDIAGSSPFTSDSPNYILDAVVMWNFYENFELWVGQTKLPGNRERVVSSANLQFVDRSLLNSRFNIDRDLGLQLRHHTDFSESFIMREMIVVSQGEGRNVTTGNLGGHQYTGRLEILPLGNFSGKGDYVGGDLQREETPKLALGATYDFNHNAVKNRSNQGSYMANDEGFYETNISTLFVDAMFKYRGFSLMAEYSNRDAEDALAKNSDGTLTGDVVQVGNGLNLQAGYVFKSNWEVAGRYTTIDLDQNITGKDVENQYTLGLSKYIVGHKLKVQTDISYTTIGGENDNLMYRLQMDIHF
ncbi:porin [Aequorivita antarctica]|uniref:Porin n=1 Tax=Aequorivita antarctica TaxID=153266 RepID=A0A5C6Z686_9FLAO|nr:porin [Aequorivita antarctica]TXD74942.1 porin [Aequorivita antarctica]